MSKKIKTFFTTMKLSILFVLVASFNLYAQQGITVTGTVTDKGDPLPGVTVTIKGTTSGTAADANGKFSLTVPNANAVLVFTFVGYVSQEITVGNRQSLEVELIEDFQSLEEVVVVGYGTQRKSDLTGSLVSVKGADLNVLPTMRPDAALQGRAAGVSVLNTDGAPGGNVMIRIRGGNSISGSNEALIVVDGMQGADITLINPNDIASMEVLKDASATAIYGARGANGVIMITTKRGASGKPSLTYDYALTSQQLNKKVDLLNAAEFAQKSNDYQASQNARGGALIEPILPFTEQHIRDFEKNGGTDWQDELFRTGLIHKHQLTMSGGNESFQYFVSGGYMSQEGILVNTDYQRYNLRSNLDATVTKWMKVGVNLNMMKAEGNVPPVGEGTRYGDILGQVINTLLRFDPCTPPYNADGFYNFKANQGPVPNSGAYAEVDVWNPLATALETYNVKNQFRQEANVYLDFTILDGLTLRITGAAAISNENTTKYQGMKTQLGYGTNGLGSQDNGSDQYYQNSNILTYSKVFKDHRLSVMGAAEQQVNFYKGSYIQAQGFFSDATGIKDLASASLINEKYTDYSKRALNSWLGRINYSYKDRYMLTASIRADGSSVFGANNKWGYFPSVSVAYNIAEEEFMKGLDVISMMKIRASWGKTGNQAISPFQTLPTVASGNDYPYLGTGSRQTGYMMGSPGNDNLKWETTAQTNIGLDLGFFNQRLTITADLYKKTTTDLLMSAQLPAFTGFTSIISNVGSIENKGLELQIAATPVATRDIRWTSDANISFNRSKVLKMSTDRFNINTNTGGGYNIYGSGFALKQLRIGEPVEQMYGWVCLGTWSTAEAAEAAKYGRAPGEQKFLDVYLRDNPGAEVRNNITRAVDGDEIIGNAAPKFFYGWNNNISYKEFMLSFLIQGSYGNDIFNATRIRAARSNNGTFGELRNRWTVDNQNTDVPGFIPAFERSQLDLGRDRMNPSDNRWSRWVEDGSYIRLKNIILNYALPKSLIGSWPVERLSFYIAATNLVTITKYSGFDPEVSSFNVRAGALGIDLSNYPTARTYSVGLNITF